MANEFVWTAETLVSSTGTLTQTLRTGGPQTGAEETFLSGTFNNETLVGDADRGDS